MINRPMLRNYSLLGQHHSSLGLWGGVGVEGVAIINGYLWKFEGFSGIILVTGDENTNYGEKVKKGESVTQ